MHYSTVIAIVAAIAPFAAADCCYPTNNICSDGTEPTPYCGYGSCNVFGCACEGGCRGAAAAKSSSNSIAADNTATADAFHAANVDGSGELTLQQFTQYVGAQDDDAVYVELFDKYDTDGNGVITLEEILQ
ncbi:hypothetical protein SLS58_002905 [Diplodia intermedia]|uniref:EF-hand domain-containing protein n=1 Tax=Diplodia intermedia TaxID=856260 RepID=A0ABR3TYR0_9PEZI